MEVIDPPTSAEVFQELLKAISQGAIDLTIRSDKQINEAVKFRFFNISSAEMNDGEFITWVDGFIPPPYDSSLSGHFTLALSSRGHVPATLNKSDAYPEGF